MKMPYECCVCGRQNVKLWRPYMGTEPLICAKCAEERQAPQEYDEYIWEKKDNMYVGKYTGRQLPLPKWEVNDKGKVPSNFGPVPECLSVEMTTQLIISLKDVSEAYSSSETVMVPAVPNENGIFLGDASIPEELCKWWEELPTK